MSVEGYCNYLQSKRFVAQKQIPFYARWVTQYLQFCNSIEDQTTPEKNVTDFLCKIGKRCEQWQVAQGSKGSSLLLTHFMMYYESRADLTPFSDPFFTFSS